MFSSISHWVQLRSYLYRFSIRSTIHTYSSRERTRFVYFGEIYVYRMPPITRNSLGKTLEVHNSIRVAENRIILMQWASPMHGAGFGRHAQSMTVYLQRQKKPGKRERKNLSTFGIRWSVRCSVCGGGHGTRVCILHMFAVLLFRQRRTHFMRGKSCGGELNLSPIYSSRVCAPTICGIFCIFVVIYFDWCVFSWQSPWV